MNNTSTLHLFAGGTASGKTTIAKEVNDYLSNKGINTLLISQDDYTICNLTDVNIKDVANYDFDKPYAIDTKHLFSDITNLLNKQEVLLPKFYFGDKPKEYNVTKSGTPDVILLEGTFVLYYEYLTYIAKNKIFIDVDEKIRLDRRLQRDVVERNIPEEKVLDRFYKFVRKSHDNFIQPSIENANYVIKNNVYNIEDLIKIILN